MLSLVSKKFSNWQVKEHNKEKFEAFYNANNNY